MAHLGLLPQASTQLPLLGKLSGRGSTITLERLGIRHLAKRTFNTLSGGEQQLVLLARALAQQAQLLILDEPAASLDLANQIQVLEQIQRLRQQGLGILLCTHHSDHARHLADRLLLVKNQRLHQYAASELNNSARLAWLYDLTEQQVQRYFLTREHHEPSFS